MVLESVQICLTAHPAGRAARALVLLRRPEQTVSEMNREHAISPESSTSCHTADSSRQWLRGDKLWQQEYKKHTVVTPSFVRPPARGKGRSVKQLVMTLSWFKNVL